MSLFLPKISSWLRACFATFPTSSSIAKRTFPGYAPKHEPHSRLYSGETWQHSKFAAHAQLLVLDINYAVYAKSPILEEVDTSATDDRLNNGVEDGLDWLLSARNTIAGAGYSAVPPSKIAVEKDSGRVDSLYLNAYSYSHGHAFQSTRLGNHVGDRKHTMACVLTAMMSSILMQKRYVTPCLPLYLRAEDPGRIWGTWW
ncbi:uncharacterized protein LY89DRAFT_778544 [Mollisia scopiformis]|uniref:Uncharacterized protein n=1 Tax=Mollisia scopiformis TaxID=149040 RepID=A0A194XL88_MOLSC|nr:uncharacterized protein LY89DRAFT_778544 [Mollisia scopiformis]KUJ20896.1 hypothetical protein LY89DRAFT_778544 [Mollisia scopiformis]